MTLNNKPPSNRRVLHLVPPPKPLPRNEKIVTLRKSALDDVVYYLVLAVASTGLGVGMCLSAVCINDRASALLELLLLLVGSVLVATGFRHARKVLRAWRMCDLYDDRLMRKHEALASVVRPVTVPDQLPFSDHWIN